MMNIQQKDRYKSLLYKHKSLFPEPNIHFFSSPGRTEIGGNHTDHNHGRVLCAAVNLDSIAAAARTDEQWVTIYSESFENPFNVSLHDLSIHSEEIGTTEALIRGIAARFNELGYEIGGFNACINSDVMIGSGLSSSASIEVLIGMIFNTLYNDNCVSSEQLAKIGQYAENVYFGKPCGLMDQLACATGGIIAIDFKHPENPRIESVDFDFNTSNYQVLIVDTGGNHADLTEDYAAIPNEMKNIAKVFEKSVCREVTFEQIMQNLQTLRMAAGDRAVLRAIHFYHENERVIEQVKALKDNDIETFLHLVNASGLSSFHCLQNGYSLKNPQQQGITLTLALTRQFLKGLGTGACRVHGGGFAGTIQVFMPNDSIADYINWIRPAVGEGSVSILNIRNSGVRHLGGEDILK